MRLRADVARRLLCSSQTGGRALPHSTAAGDDSAQATEKDDNDHVAVVLAHYEAEALVQLQTLRRRVDPNDNLPVEGSFGVNLSTDTLTQVTLRHDGVLLPLHPEIGGSGPACILLLWTALRAMSKRGKTGAFECLSDGSYRRIASFSEHTQRALSLLPLHRGVPPTVLLGGFGMHRLKDADPGEDTRLKMRALQRPRGRALDICTGLGYTALALAAEEVVSHVTTIELDPAMVAMQRRNAWSAPLFRNAKVERVVGDAVEILPKLPDAAFDVVVHDPPARVLGGELYSAEFYAQLQRVMAAGGRLYHYVGRPNSVEAGRLYAGVMERLRQAGFGSVRRADAAFGVTARKDGRGDRLGGGAAHGDWQSRRPSRTRQGR